VDVARESADIVLLKRDLDVLRLGIEGGRRTFANTLKYICIVISANFGNVVSMALAAPVLPFLPMSAKQVLLNNFLADVPAVTLATDAVDAAQVATPRRLGIGDIQRFMVVFGLLSSVFDLLTFWVLLKVVQAGVGVFQTGWFVLSLMTELAALLVLRTQGPIWRSRPGCWLLAVTLAVAVVGVTAPFVPGLDAIFDFRSLPPELLGLLALIVVAYAAASEAAKRWFFSRSGRRTDARAAEASPC
jgi:Mg2+-importing ATPase